jgi:hypothetical protein
VWGFGTSQTGSLRYSDSNSLSPLLPETRISKMSKFHYKGESMAPVASEPTVDIPPNLMNAKIRSVLTSLQICEIRQSMGFWHFPIKNFHYSFLKNLWLKRIGVFPTELDFCEMSLILISLWTLQGTISPHILPANSSLQKLFFSHSLRKLSNNLWLFGFSTLFTLCSSCPSTFTLVDKL